MVAPGSCNPFSSIPSWNVPGASVNPLNTTGNYDYTAYNADHLNDFNCSGTQYCSPGGGLVFADPYYGGRGPQYISFSFGFQKQINKKAVFSADYSGSETHFLPGGSGRGYAQNTFSPDYMIGIRDQHCDPPDTSAGLLNPSYVGYTAACPHGNQRPFPGADLPAPTQPCRPRSGPSRSSADSPMPGETPETQITTPYSSRSPSARGTTSPASSITRAASRSTTQATAGASSPCRAWMETSQLPCPQIGSIAALARTARSTHST